MKKNVRSTKSLIVQAAWKLFYEVGYDNTTVDDIVEASGTSKGSFYHYFDSKDSLPASLGYLFDEKYEELRETLDPAMNPYHKLIALNQELFLMIENRVAVDLLSRLLSSQLISKAEQSLLDSNRTYYKILRQIAVEGLQDGTFKKEYTTNDIIKAYAMFERGLLYDWCLSGGNYSLCRYSANMLPAFLNIFLNDSETKPAGQAAENETKGEEQ